MTIRDFKNLYAQRKGYDDWYDYHNWCKSNGFDASEVGYDDIAIQFARLHVESALLTASKKACLTDFASEFLQEGSGDAIDIDSILQSYPLNKVK